MARTRAQEKAGAAPKPASPAKQDTKKRSHSRTQEPTASKNQSSKKPKTESKPGSEHAKKPTNQEPSASTPPSRNPKIQTLLSSYGSTPLSSTALTSPTTPSASTLLAHLLNALLSSARLSHDLAARTVATVIRAGWHHLDVLKATSWQQRTEVLTEGGYTRYREKTATGLGELVEFLEREYGMLLLTTLNLGWVSPDLTLSRSRKTATSTISSHPLPPPRRPKSAKSSKKSKDSATSAPTSSSTPRRACGRVWRLSWIRGA